MLLQKSLSLYLILSTKINLKKSLLPIKKIPNEIKNKFNIGVEIPIQVKINESGRLVDSTYFPLNNM